MRNFSTLIQNWYLKSGRDLPWRSTNDPYKIWLSEIILQQTRVDQGLEYYLKFVEQYPHVQALASASEDHILNNWQGLGYYSRARNLHAAAKFIVQHHQGVFPTSYKEVIALKGVGEYTAAAVCSIAYGLPHAVVDGNVYRVLSRYLNLSTPIDSTRGKKEFAQAAQELLDSDNPSTHNQGVMELGALVCTPKNPNCEACPLNSSCEGYEKGTWMNLPIKEKKTKVRDRYFNYVILQEGDKLLLKKRGPKDVWEGLYDFYLMEANVARELSEEDLKDFNVREIVYDGKLKHILSHQRIHAAFWLVKVKGLKARDEFILIDKNELENYPMPQLLIRYLDSSEYFGAD